MPDEQPPSALISPPLGRFLGTAGLSVPSRKETLRPLRAVCGLLRQRQDAARMALGGPRRRRRPRGVGAVAPGRRRHALPDDPSTRRHSPSRLVAPPWSGTLGCGHLPDGGCAGPRAGH
eukprot:3000273-Alexandrium_andersonii.AAC.1